MILATSKVTNKGGNKIMKNIVYSRVDDRLVHGQVMTAWVQTTGANCVVIVDDKVAKDTFLQMVMKQSMPGKIKLEVLTIEQAVTYLTKDDPKLKLFILVKTPNVVLDLVEKGVAFRSLGVGGMGAKPERSTLYRNISASEDEKAALVKLQEKGLDVFFQVTPDTNKVQLSSVL